MIGNQSIGEPPISIIKGSPKAAPPKPSPVLTKPDQEKIKATSPNSNAVKLMFSSGRSYIVLIKTILYLNYDCD